MTTWTDLVALGEQVGEKLRSRGESIAVGEGSAGGLVSAAILAVPGASAYYLGGCVVYTGRAIKGFLEGAVERPEGMRGATEEFARYCADSTRVQLRATWGIGEAGAAGPPNRYGDPAGHTWLAVTGPSVYTRNVLTGSGDRVENMFAFAAAALSLLLEALSN
jgi:nicotinamide-nucleotide amidase